MNKKISFLILIGLPSFLLGSGLPTIDAASIAANQAASAQRTVEHGENIAKWVEQLQRAQEQVTKLQEGVELATKMKNVMGDPVGAITALTEIAGVPTGGGKTMGELGKLGSEISKTGGQLQSLSGDVKSLYNPININNPLEKLSGDLSNSSDPFAKYGAVESHFKNLSDTISQSESEAADIRKQIDTLSKKTSSTEAEQRQKQADLTALQTKLDDAEKRSVEAAQKLQAMHTLNENDSEKQRKFLALKRGKQNQADATRAATAREQNRKIKRDLGDENGN